MFFHTLLLILTTFISIADAQTQRIENTEVELIANVSQAKAGEIIKAGVRYKMDPDWHIYWNNPGDSGIPTTIQWLNAEASSATINTPTPHKIEVPPLLVNYGWYNEVVLWSNITIPKNTGSEYFLQANTTFLMCKDICLPGEASLNLSIPIGEESIESTNKAAFEQAEAQTAKEIAAVPVYYNAQNKTFTLEMKTETWGKNPIFIPELEGEIEDNEPQVAKSENGKTTLTIKQDRFLAEAPQSLKGILISKDHKNSAILSSMIAVATPTEATSITQSISTKESPTQGASEIADMTLVTALILAFVGGLILNLMPCVLPVLSLKVMGLVHHAQSKWSWFFGLVYTAGVLSTFYLLALALIMLKEKGLEMGWGFQLQEPMFVASLATVMFLISLELFNVFEIGTTFGRLQNIVGRKNNVITTFLSGMLITIVATPCTVPFMGGAVAYSLGQDSNITIAIFLTLGAGLAFPYLLLTFVPSLRKRLPKPGPWEAKFQEFLGFPMIATMLWLTWVYAKQTSLDELFLLFAGLLILGLGAWTYGHLGSLTSTWKRKVFAFIIFWLSLGVCIASFGGHKVIAKDLLKKDWFEKIETVETNWQPWSKQAIQDAKDQGRPVFVNFTADWCVTCKANEAAVLSRKSTIDFFERSGILLLKADWTKKDEIIGAELARYGRRGIPLYVAINKNGEEKTLQQILTPSAVQEHFE